MPEVEPFQVITIRWDEDYGGLVYDLDGVDDYSAIAMLDHVRRALMDDLEEPITAEDLTTATTDDDD